MRFKDIKYVIFDLDGTITDPKDGITKSAAYALEAFGYGSVEPYSLDWFIGPPLHKSFMEYTGCTEDEGMRLVEKYRERYRTIGVHENILYPGIKALLEYLRSAGKILAVASSKPTVFVNQILDDFGLKEYFTVIEGSDLAGKHVEKEDVLSSALSKLGNDAVMVGDRKFDIDAAHALGIQAIGVSYGYARAGELEEAGADCIASTPDDVRSAIETLEMRRSENFS